MNELNRSKLPSLIVVTGRPASGKTTLAHTLARKIRCPIISRDEIKEGLINTIKTDEKIEDKAKWQVYNTFFEVIELLLTNSTTLVAEAAFQHKLWIPKLELLESIAEIRIIYCRIEPELARLRFIQRGLSDPQRAFFHSDRAVQAAKEEILPIGNYNPPIMNVPTLTVNTSNEYEPKIEDIVSFIHNRE